MAPPKLRKGSRLLPGIERFEPVTLGQMRGHGSAIFSAGATTAAAGLVGGEGFSIDASLIRADAAKKKRLPGDQPIAWPKTEEASRAVREYLAVLDAARSEEEESGGGDDSGASGGGSRRSAPKEVSLTDPQAAWVARKGTDPFFAYDANYLIDNKAGIIVDAEGTRANRAAEIAITETMIDRIKRRFARRDDGRVLQHNPPISGHRPMR